MSLVLSSSTQSRQGSLLDTDFRLATLSADEMQDLVASPLLPRSAPGSRQSRNTAHERAIRRALDGASPRGTGRFTLHTSRGDVCVGEQDNGDGAAMPHPDASPQGRPRLAAPMLDDLAGDDEYDAIRPFALRPRTAGTTAATASPQGASSSFGSKGLPMLYESPRSRPARGAPADLQRQRALLDDLARGGDVAYRADSESPDAGTLRKARTATFRRDRTRDAAAAADGHVNDRTRAARPVNIAGATLAESVDADVAAEPMVLLVPPADDSGIERALGLVDDDTDGDPSTATTISGDENDEENAAAADSDSDGETITITFNDNRVSRAVAAVRIGRARWMQVWRRVVARVIVVLRAARALNDARVSLARRAQRHGVEMAELVNRGALAALNALELQHLYAMGEGVWAAEAHAFAAIIDAFARTMPAIGRHEAGVMALNVSCRRVLQSTGPAGASAAATTVDEGGAYCRVRRPPPAAASLGTISDLDSSPPRRPPTSPGSNPFISPANRDGATEMFDFDVPVSDAAVPVTIEVWSSDGVREAEHAIAAVQLLPQHLPRRGRGTIVLSFDWGFAPGVQPVDATSSTEDIANAPVGHRGPPNGDASSAMEDSVVFGGGRGGDGGKPLVLPPRQALVAAYRSGASAIFAAERRAWRDVLDAFELGLATADLAAGARAADAERAMVRAEAVDRATHLHHQRRSYISDVLEPAGRGRVEAQEAAARGAAFEVMFASRAVIAARPDRDAGNTEPSACHSGDNETDDPPSAPPRPELVPRPPATPPRTAVRPTPPVTPDVPIESAAPPAPLADGHVATSSTPEARDEAPALAPATEEEESPELINAQRAAAVAALLAPAVREAPRRHPMAPRLSLSNDNDAPADDEPCPRPVTVATEAAALRPVRGAPAPLTARPPPPGPPGGPHAAALAAAVAAAPATARPAARLSIADGLDASMEHPASTAAAQEALLHRQAYRSALFDPRACLHPTAQRKPSMHKITRIEEERARWRQRQEAIEVAARQRTPPPAGGSPPSSTADELTLMSPSARRTATVLRSGHGSPTCEGDKARRRRRRELRSTSTGARRQRDARPAMEDAGP